MKYAVVEETDGVGNTHYEAMVQTKGWFGRVSWDEVYDHHTFSRKKFKTADEALAYLRKVFIKNRKIVQEGEL